MRVLYVDCDTLRPDHLGCYGYHRNTSPTVDALAGEGVRFDSCYVSDAPCLPSRTALFSGRFGIRTGVVGHAGTSAQMRYPGDGHVTDPARRPLPLALSINGTHATTISTFGQRHTAFHFYAGWDEIQKFSNLGGNEIATDVEAAAIRWLEHRGREDNWFCHVNYWDPHTPYRTPEAYGNPFAGDPAGEFPSEETITAQQDLYGPLGARDICAVMPRTPWVPEQLASRADFKTWIDGYDTGIRFFDDSLARVIDTLDRIGVLDDTAIVFSSDHGENQGELNLYGAHLTADSITCRVPLIVKWPGMDHGTVVDQPIHQLDLAPTICELLDHDTPAQWDGISFAPALRGESWPVRPYLVFGMGAWTVQRGILRDGHLYIRTYHPALDPMPDELLFHLPSDPHEERNLTDSEPRVAGDLSRMMSDWWSDAAPQSGRDPLLTIIDEGGALYPRTTRAAYLKLLRETGREDVAELLAARKIAPVVDPYDMSRH